MKEEEMCVDQHRIEGKSASCIGMTQHFRTEKCRRKTRADNREEKRDMISTRAS